MPSFWAMLDHHARAKCEKSTFAAAVSGIDPSARARSIDMLLEGLLATRGKDDLAAILARVPWHVVPLEGWPVRSETWRPPLDEAALDTLFARLVKLDGKRPHTNRMSSFLAGLIPHPISRLGAHSRQCLLRLMQDRRHATELRIAAARLAAVTRDVELAQALATSGWSPRDEPDVLVASYGAQFLLGTLHDTFPLSVAVERFPRHDLPLLADRLPDSELSALMSHMVTAGDEWQSEAVDRAARSHAMLGVTPLGAARLWAACAPVIEHWLLTLAKEDRTFAPGSPVNELARTLALGNPGSSCSLAYVHGVLRYFARTGGQRPLARPVIRIALAVAAHAASGERLLDSLLLCMTDDRSLAAVATAAVDAGPPILTVLLAWIERAMTSGHVAQIAYALTLTGFLVPFVPELRAHFDHPGVARGFLCHVAERARRVAHRIECADRWVGVRIQATTPARACAAEALALACKPPMMPPRARAWSSRPSDIDELFYLRLSEMVLTGNGPSTLVSARSEHPRLHGTLAPFTQIVLANALAALEH
ncbi:MAG TPA: hypothetical protein VGD80_41975 [Kofleriaceae bacterium]